MGRTSVPLLPLWLAAVDGHLLVRTTSHLWCIQAGASP